LNLRPLGYEPNELPDCSTPRLQGYQIRRFRQIRLPSKRSRRPIRLLFVTRRICLSLLLLSATAFLGARDVPGLGKHSKDTTLDPLLHRVEQRYNKATTLVVHFTEEYEAGKRVRHSEAGTLELRKPGKMRWDYSEPAGKQFIADGKHFYLYTPGTNRAEVTPMRDSEDMRAPLAFLLGKLNFYKEFSGFVLRPDGNNVWIEAEPNSPAMPYSKVEFLVTSEARIGRLRVTGDDLSIMDFTFADEKLNAPVAPDRFVFHLPKGAELEDDSK
jgi:outer membrane lipoprotein carrier protein